MSQSDLDTKKAIIEMKKELDFEKFKNEIIQIFNENQEIVLATSSKNPVTSRIISFRLFLHQTISWSNLDGEKLVFPSSKSFLISIGSLAIR